MVNEHYIFQYTRLKNSISSVYKFTMFISGNRQKDCTSPTITSPTIGFQRQCRFHHVMCLNEHKLILHYFLQEEDYQGSLSIKDLYCFIHVRVTDRKTYNPIRDNRDHLYQELSIIYLQHQYHLIIYLQHQYTEAHLSLILYLPQVRTVGHMQSLVTDILKPVQKKNTGLVMSEASWHKLQTLNRKGRT